MPPVKLCVHRSIMRSATTKKSRVCRTCFSSLSCDFRINGLNTIKLHLVDIDLVTIVEFIAPIHPAITLSCHRFFPLSVYLYTYMCIEGYWISSNTRDFVDILYTQAHTNFMYTQLTHTTSYEHSFL